MLFMLGIFGVNCRTSVLGCITFDAEQLCCSLLVTVDEPGEVSFAGSRKGDEERGHVACGAAWYMYHTVYRIEYLHESIKYGVCEWGEPASTLSLNAGSLNVPKCNMHNKQGKKNEANKKKPGMPTITTKSGYSYVYANYQQNHVRGLAVIHLAEHAHTTSLTAAQKTNIQATTHQTDAGAVHLKRSY